MQARRACKAYNLVHSIRHDFHKNLTKKDTQLGRDVDTEKEMRC